MAQDFDQAVDECYDSGKYHVTNLNLKLTSIQVLVFAMGLSFGVGDYIEGGVLVAVIVLNVSVGFYQELSAEKKMDSLRALSSPSASVLRDGKVDVISRFVVHSPLDFFHIANMKQ